MKRRTFARLGGVGISTLAGCLGGDEQDDEPTGDAEDVTDDTEDEPMTEDWLTDYDEEDVSDDKGFGFRGIWYELTQFDGEYGDKYSGGLGTYTMKHAPIAVHAPEESKTFFTYGGVSSGRDLQVMASVFDHEDGTVRNPTIVDPKPGVSDPHDNGSILLDEAGFVWMFVSGRGDIRPGRRYRSLEPYDVDAFVMVAEEEFAYPQPWLAEDRIVQFYTRYRHGRDLFYKTADTLGAEWSEESELAAFGGHYQVSCVDGDRLFTAFNWHPGANVDARTNLYVVTSADYGESWQTLGGTDLEIPLEGAGNPARVIDQERERLLYVKDITVDAAGNPVVLHLTSADFEPGPSSDPRRWEVTRWTGSAWDTVEVTRSDHNYDSGSLYIDGDTWRVYGPTGEGPQSYHTGGEVDRWISEDAGDTWTLEAEITSDSLFNHSYVRRPIEATDPLGALWADGDPSEMSQSRIHFGELEGDGVWHLPYEMRSDWEEPIRGTPDYSW